MPQADGKDTYFPVAALDQSPRVQLNEETQLISSNLYTSLSRLKNLGNRSRIGFTSLVDHLIGVYV